MNETASLKAESNAIASLEQFYEAVKNDGTKYALVQFNIKNFRYFNTKYRSAGDDEILALVLARLRSLLAPAEFAWALYADNFAALLQYTDAHALLYQRLMQLIDTLYRIEDERIYRNPFMSIGIYEITDPAVSLDDALNYANISRKECETLFNRSSCMELYDQGFYSRYMDRMQLETDTASAYKNYEFTAYLQPKVDLKSGRIVGAEALLRWFDKNGDMIPLYKYLPIGYIRLVDLDVVERACKHLSQRLKEGKPVVPISFNLSKGNFHEPNIVENYVNIIEKYDIPKQLAEIELMESISLDDPEYIKKVISKFKNRGFTCSLDDFGNGFSPFNILLNAPWDIIKMDRQFFKNNLNGDSRLVVKTIVELIHSLNMKVVAEGVELQEHIDWLKQCGCDFVPGYYYYKPMSIEAFEELLDSPAQASSGM